MEAHPGGEEILLQFGGKDITNVMDDPNEHSHSDSAYEMLEEYYIGDLNHSPNTVLLQKSKPFIDVTKPMLWQVWTGNFSKEEYLKQVHIPRHTKGSAPIFGSPFLEVFSKTKWWVIPIFWTPIISYCMKQCINDQGMRSLLFLFPFGLFLWTLIEYALHRFIFHLDDLLPDHRAAITLHFLLHGVHHFLPMDRFQILM
jgi:4-hydroxysphinganine ceramide fatty acyl 2-hydroxylase